MKKIILSLVAAIVATTATYAQSSLLATLSHGGTITTYYGATALSAAHEAAVDGDIITLSSGSFNTVTITKGITIRGAGMAIDPTTQSEPTILKCDFSITMAQEAASRLTIEGVYCNGEATINANLIGATFLKSRFKKLSSGNYKVENLTMIHCKVTNGMSFNTNNATFSCLNCIIWEPMNSPGEFINCVIRKQTLSYYLSPCTFKNCIFVGCMNSTFDNNNTI